MGPRWRQAWEQSMTMAASPEFDYCLLAQSTGELITGRHTRLRNHRKAIFRSADTPGAHHLMSDRRTIPWKIDGTDRDDLFSTAIRWTTSSKAIRNIVLHEADGLKMYAFLCTYVSIQKPNSRNPLRSLLPTQSPMTIPVKFQFAII